MQEIIGVKNAICSTAQKQSLVYVKLDVEIFSLFDKNMHLSNNFYKNH